MALQQAVTVAAVCGFHGVILQCKLYKMCQQQCVCHKEVLGEELVLHTARPWPDPGPWGPPGAGEEHDSVWNRVLHRLEMIALHTVLPC